MAKKPSYEELELRVKTLEKEALERKQDDEFLLRGKDFSESIIDSLPGIFYLFDEKGKFIRWNKNFESVSGYSAGEIATMSPLDFFVGVDKRNIAERIQDVFMKGSSSAEANFVSKSGSETLFYLTGHLIRIGNAKYLAGMGINITDRKQIEETLRESEEKYRTLISNIPDVTWTTDSEGKTSFISPNIAREFGYAQEEIYKGGDSIWLGRIHPEDVGKVEEAFKKLFEKGTMFDVEYRIKRKDGEWIWFHDRSVGVYERDGVKYADGIFSNITSRKRNEEALREREQVLRTFVAHTPAAVAMCDREMRYIVYSRRWAKHYGLGEEDLIGRCHYDVFPDLPEHWKQEHQECFSGEIVSRDEEPFPRADGSIDWVKRKLSPWRDDAGKIGGLIIFTEVITAHKEAEQTLREKERFHEGLLNDMITFVAVLDPGGDVIFVNNTPLKVGGIKLEDIIGKKFFDAFWWAHSDEVREMIKRDIEQCASGESIIHDVPIQTADGSLMWIEFSMHPIHDEYGVVQYLIPEGRDITKNKEVEAALRESEEKYKKLFDTSPEAVALVNEEGRFLTANPSMKKRFEQEIEGKTWHELMPKDIADSRLEQARQAIKNDEAVFFEDARAGRYMENYYVPVPTSGEKGTFQVIVRDITERKQADAALRESEEKFRLISEQSLLAIGIIQDGHIIYANEMYSKLTGYSLEDIYGWEPYGYARTVYKDDIPLVMKQSRKKQAGDEDVITNYQFRGFTKSKEIVWWDLHSNTITYHGRPADLFTLIDITEKVESEKERVALQTKLQHSQKMEAIGTLAGGVAHDLNNILGGLVSYPELLLFQLPLDSPLRKSILTIQKSGEKAAAVVQDLLTLARRGVVVTEVVNLNDVIAEYLKSPEHEKLQSYHPGVHMDAHLEKDTLNILGSSTHLSKTVMNLVSNAAEAMPEGGKIYISTENRYVDRPIGGYGNVKEGDYVVLIISDTGTGISPDDMEKIFEPFYTKKKMGRSGTGLGMAVVWGTVKDHNGYIDVQSTEEKGATFTLYFPVTREKLPENESHLAIGSYSGNGESILVIFLMTWKNKGRLPQEC